MLIVFLRRQDQNRNRPTATRTSPTWDTVRTCRIPLGPVTTISRSDTVSSPVQFLVLMIPAKTSPFQEFADVLDSPSVPLMFAA